MTKVIAAAVLTAGLAWGFDITPSGTKLNSLTVGGVNVMSEIATKVGTNAIVQTTGTNATQVMSQAASTASFIQAEEDPVFTNWLGTATFFTPTDLETDYSTDYTSLTNSIAGKLGTNAVTQTVTSEAAEVPSGAAVTSALSLKAGTTNAVLSWTATAGGTNYVYQEFYDATNNVKRFIRTP